MLRTITQKCPSCGYVYVEQQHVEVQTVSIEKRYTHRPVRKLNPIRGKERVYRKNCVKFKNKPSYDKIKKS